MREVRENACRNADNYTIRENTACPDFELRAGRSNIVSLLRDFRTHNKSFCIEKGRHQFVMDTKIISMNVACLTEFGSQPSQPILGIPIFASRPHTLP